MGEKGVGDRHTGGVVPEGVETAVRFHPGDSWLPEIMAESCQHQAEGVRCLIPQCGCLVINGNIQMPVLGEIHVAGLTRLRLQDTLTAMLKNGGFLDEPFVSVRFNNFKIFFLGNGRGSVINISNERCTFLEAMAMLGDFDLYTRRDRIGVMREINGKMVMRYLDPRSSDIFNDPFFMLQQNDFIITETFTSGLAWSEFNKWIGIVSTVLSLTSLVTSIAILTKMK